MARPRKDPNTTIETTSVSVQTSVLPLVQGYAESLGFPTLREATESLITSGIKQYADTLVKAGKADGLTSEQVIENLRNLAPDGTVRAYSAVSAKGMTLATVLAQSRSEASRLLIAELSRPARERYHKAWIDGNRQVTVETLDDVEVE